MQIPARTSDPTVTHRLPEIARVEGTQKAATPTRDCSHQLSAAAYVLDLTPDFVFFDILDHFGHTIPDEQLFDRLHTGMLSVYLRVAVKAGAGGRGRGGSGLHWYMRGKERKMKKRKRKRGRVVEERQHVFCACTGSECISAKVALQRARGVRCWVVVGRQRT